MSLLYCKPTVRIEELTPGLSHIIYHTELFVRHCIYTPSIIYITSIDDSKHGIDSRHYKGEALDIRSLNFSNQEDKERFRSDLELSLNKTQSTRKFRVLFEKRIVKNGIISQEEHFHVQVAKGTVFP